MRKIAIIFLLSALLICVYLTIDDYLNTKIEKYNIEDSTANEKTGNYLLR